MKQPRIAEVIEEIVEQRAGQGLLCQGADGKIEDTAIEEAPGCPEADDPHHPQADHHDPDFSTRVPLCLLQRNDGTAGDGAQECEGQDQAIPQEGIGHKGPGKAVDHTQGFEDVAQGVGGCVPAADLADALAGEREGTRDLPQEFRGNQYQQNAG